MPQPKLSFNAVKAIIDDVKCMDRKFYLDHMGEGYYLQVQYMEEDVETGKMEKQHSRKWYISPYSTKTEIVETAFAAVKRSFEHVIKEHFYYKGERVYSPHYDIEARLDMCRSKRFDKRQD